MKVKWLVDLLWQLDARHSHGGDAFFPSDESHRLVGGGLDSNPFDRQSECLGDVLFHLGDVRCDLRLLSEEGGIDIQDAPFEVAHLTGCFGEENMAGSPFPTRVCVWKKMADVALTDRAEHRISDGVKQRIRIGVPVQTFRVRDFYPTQDEFATRYQLMNIVTDAD